MLNITIESNIDDVIRKFDLLEKKLPNEIEKLLDETASKVKYSIEEDLKIGYAYGNMKKKSGKPYYYTGKLFDSINKQRVNDLEYEVFVGNERSEIAKYIYYNQHREFFRIHPDISKYLDNKISSLIK